MFPSFTKLPPELRDKIWQDAVDGDWSYSHFWRGVGPQPRMELVGKICRSQAGDVCRESRAVMKSTYTWWERYGWIDFNKHLFFFRDDKFDWGMLEHVGETLGLFEHVQHITLCPRAWWRATDTFELLSKHCRQLRTVVIIGPWLGPLVPGREEEDVEFRPQDEFGPVFSQSPAEMDLTALFEAFDGDYAAEIARMDQYKAKLDEIVVRVRRLLGDAEDSSWYHARRVLHLIEERDMPKFPSPPRLFLRWREELCPSEVPITSPFRRQTASDSEEAAQVIVRQRT